MTVPRLVQGPALALCAVLALSVGPAVPAPAPRPLLATVTRVVDGDSLWLAPRDGGPAIELRLAGIDAPEICQAGGAAARRALADRVKGRTVQLQLRPGAAGRDVHGRALGTVFVDGMDINRELVAQGQAWNQRFKRDPGPYADAERQARAHQRGVHAPGLQPVLPRDFRRVHGPCHGR